MANATTGREKSKSMDGNVCKPTRTARMRARRTTKADDQDGWVFFSLFVLLLIQRTCLPRSIVVVVLSLSFTLSCSTETQRTDRMAASYSLSESEWPTYAVDVLDDPALVCPACRSTHACFLGLDPLPVKLVDATDCAGIAPGHLSRPNALLQICGNQPTRACT